MYHRHHQSVTPATVYFGRWSRNPAAVFHSRHAVVLISCLKSNVLERLQLKGEASQTVGVQSHSSLAWDHPDTPADDDSLPLPILELYSLLLDSSEAATQAAQHPLLLQCTHRVPVGAMALHIQMPHDTDDGDHTAIGIVPSAVRSPLSYHWPWRTKVRKI